MSFVFLILNNGTATAASHMRHGLHREEVTSTTTGLSDSDGSPGIEDRPFELPVP